MTSGLLDGLLSRWGKLTPLTRGDEGALRALPWTVKSFRRDDFIVREGDLVKSCALLLRGLAYRQKGLLNGSRQIISFHIPNEFLDLQNSLFERADHSVQALSDVQAMMVPQRMLADLGATSPAIGRAIFLDTLIDSSVFREWVVNVGRRDARARISHLLCEFALRLQTAGIANPERIDFPLTQSHLADATGLTPVHTNRVLQGLRRDGLIRYESRVLTILDWPGLKAAGEFDELYLHHQANPGQARNTTEASPT